MKPFNYAPLPNIVFKNRSGSKMGMNSMMRMQEMQAMQGMQGMQGMPPMNLNERTEENIQPYGKSNQVYPL